MAIVIIDLFSQIGTLWRASVRSSVGTVDDACLGGVGTEQFRRVGTERLRRVGTERLQSLLRVHVPVQEQQPGEPRHRD